ncbi:hypothetical protein HDU93_007520 [Gonapodya sp. JEL0774]|nr:hypothetical protein HDU93_007520 [Gonapodya sp. JEL0774]
MPISPLATHFIPLIALPIVAGALAYAVSVALDELRDSFRPDKQQTKQFPDLTSFPAQPKIVDGIEGLVGNTPMVRIRSLSEETGCEILAKAEFLNPVGSSKDRVALSILLQAERAGVIAPHTGCVVYEGTVGSTGISLAAVCKARGYGCHIVMPDDQAREKYEVLEALGAVVEKVRPSSIIDPNHYVNLARRRALEFTEQNRHSSLPVPFSPRGLFADQFDNPANRAAHVATASEIWWQTDGMLDAFVMGAGTGGTLAGVAMWLKNRSNGSVRLVCADPQGSSIHNRITHGVMFSETEREGHRGRHQVDSIVEGIGLNRVTGNLASVLDDATDNDEWQLPECKSGKWIDWSEKVTDAEAAWMGRWLVENDGLWVGSSSCVNLVAAVRVARRLRREIENDGNDRWTSGKIRVVTVLCDSGSRGLSRFWNKNVIKRDVGEVGIAATSGKERLGDFVVGW